MNETAELEEFPGPNNHHQEALSSFLTIMFFHVVQGVGCANANGKMLKKKKYLLC